MAGRAIAHTVALLGALLWSGAAAAPDAQFGPGLWVELRGEFDGSTFVASEIKATDDRSASIKGTLDGFDLATGRMRLSGWTIAIDERTRLQDADGSELSRDAVPAGRRVKISLRQTEEAGVRVRRVRLLSGKPGGRIRLIGVVERTRRADDVVSFSILGIPVRVRSSAGWEGIARPRWSIDDEDVRPARGLSVAGLSRLSGEVRFDYIDERNADLADIVEDDLATRRTRARVELTFPGTRRFSGMLQIKAEEERAVEDPAGAFERRQTVTLGRAYVRLHGVLGRHGSIEVGRSRFDDDRDWLFNRDLDALRLYFDFARARLELSLAEELVDPVPRHRDAGHALISATAYPGRHHAITAYGFARDDRGLNAGGNPRDFSPRYVGLRAAGEGKRWGYWLEAARAGGSFRGQRMRGSALDVGATWVAPGRLEPSFTLGYAVGSGDDDPNDDVYGNFRQSGLHLNNGKWNGVASFRYYGEVTRPELSNIRIGTFGFGLRLKRKTSLDLIYHTYRLDAPSNELVDATFDDRRLNLIDLEVGRELDLVFGFEEFRHFELELDLGIFEPGAAFLGPQDVATMARLKLKFVF